jgi:hypothetical protein
MKIKNKIITLLSVFTLVGLTHSFTLKDLNAALTAPASYDYSYTYDGLFSYELNVSPIFVYYTRTSDGIYYNYTSTYELIDGLEITQTFNRSNTTWVFVSGEGYIPADTKIGSDNTVGTNVSQKVYMKFDNQTNKDYFLFFDVSSTTDTPSTLDFNLVLNSKEIDLYSNRTRWNSSDMKTLYIPSYSFLELSSIIRTGNIYFDAWYLQDLGVSAAYDAGLDVGELIGYDDGYADGLGNNPNVLLNGFQAMVGILVNFALMILNLEVFDVSLLGVFGVIAFFVGIIWFLKILRG